MTQPQSLHPAPPLNEVFSGEEVNWLLEDSDLAPQDFSFPESIVLPDPAQLQTEEPESPDRDDSDLLVPLRVSQLFRWLRIGFAAFVLASTLIGLVGCTSVSTVPWRPAAEVMPPTMVQQLIQTQTSVKPEVVESLKKSAAAWKIPGKQGNLALVDFNTSQLCGALGCQYLGVWLQDKQTEPKPVMVAYFKPRLPKSVPLFESTKAEVPYDTSPLPCFAANQLEGTNLRRSTLCFQNGGYSVTGSTVKPLAAKK
jgi:hypothetical protein